jgi:para-nitrobenzyl esterase
VPAGFVNANSKEELLSQFGSVKDEMKAAYDPDGTTEFAKMLTLVNTDKVWAEPARFTASAFVAKGTPAYTYLFSYVPTAMQERLRFGAPHASEVAYVFNNLNARWGAPTTTPKDQEVATMMNTYWVNFAKTGNPNGNGLPNWPMFDSKKSEIFEFKSDGSAGSTPDHRKARLDVMEKAAKAKQP